MTTRLDSTGASAGAAKLRCDCSTPYRTTASPYSRICGANTMSIRVPRATMVAFGQPGVAPSRTDITGRARMATTTLNGASSSTVQVSSAAEVCRTSRRSAPRPLAGPASTGTTTAVSAPPMTMS